MVVFVNAKINLGLNITRRREDGYHDLETLFYPVGIYGGTPCNPVKFNDILEIHLLGAGREDEFSFSGNFIDCPPERNLVVKAVKAFKEALLRKGKSEVQDYAVSLSLEKHIPDGAGLGGGSADATFTLKALNKLLGFPFTQEELISIAANLGADCPFFVKNRPVIASGIGEIMIDASINLAGWWAVIVKPAIYISTKEAFAGISPHQPEKPISEIIKYPVGEWSKRGLRNDFEPQIFEKYPLLSDIKELFLKSGASYASMSGSGSSIFGLFKQYPSATLLNQLHSRSLPVFPLLLN